MSRPRRGAGGAARDLTIRRAGRGDLAVVRAVRLRALAEAPDAFESTLEDALRWSDEDWERWIGRGATFLLVGSDGGVGIAAGTPHDSEPEAMFLESVWLDPALRGTGAAGRLVAAVLDWGAGRGARTVWLDVGARSVRARRFYERLGFRAAGEVPRERDGVLEVRMVRPIDLG